MKRIYITGIAGLIGSNLAKYYLKKGYKVSGCDNLVGGYENNIPRAANVVKLDISKTTELTEHISWHKPDVLIHCAALAYEGLSVFSPALITDNIYGGTVSVATAAIANKVPLFINCSSMARYGELETPFTEDMVCQPIDPYGLAKLHAEQQLELLSKIYPEFKYYTVIPHNVSGAQQVYTDPYRNVLSIMINQALCGRPIYIYGDGEQKRSFSHVDDCVNAIDTLIEVLPTQKIFNIGPDHNEITINKLAEIVKKETISSSDIIHLDARPQEVKNAWCSSDLAANFLNYEAKKDIYEIVSDIKDYILVNGTGYFNYKLDIQINNKPVPKTWDQTIRLFNQPNATLNSY